MADEKQGAHATSGAEFENLFSARASDAPRYGMETSLQALLRLQEEALGDSERVLEGTREKLMRAAVDLETVLVRMHRASGLVGHDGTWAPLDTARVAELVKQCRELAGRIPREAPRAVEPTTLGYSR